MAHRLQISRRLGENALVFVTDDGRTRDSASSAALGPSDWRNWTNETMLLVTW